MIKNIIIKKIIQYENILLFGHKRADGDVFGSQIGLKNIIKTTYPNKNVYILGEKPDRLSYIGVLDEANNIDFSNSLGIILDTANPERVSDKRWEQCQETIRIDHHELRGKWCDIELIKPTYSSCAELVYELYRENKDKLKISTNGAKALYAGIISDTNRFYFNSITSKTLKYASELLEYNFNFSIIHEEQYVHSENIVKFKGHVLLNYEKTDNGFAYLKITKDILNRFKLNNDEAYERINLLSEIKDVDVWAFFLEQDDKIRCGIRSRSINVNKLAEKYGGGGHKNACGITANNWDVVIKILSDIDILCKENKKK